MKNLKIKIKNKVCVISIDRLKSLNAINLEVLINLKNVLNKYRQISFSERDKGDRFERLIKAYLQTDPTYSNLFNYVWMWNEFPSKMDFAGKDAKRLNKHITFKAIYNG